MNTGKASGVRFDPANLKASSGKSAMPGSMKKAATADDEYEDDFDMGGGSAAKKGKA